MSAPESPVERSKREYVGIACNNCNKQKLKVGFPIYACRIRVLVADGDSVMEEDQIRVRVVRIVERSAFIGQSATTNSALTSVRPLALRI